LTDLNRVRLSSDDTRKAKYNRMPIRHSLRWLAVGIEEKAEKPALLVFLTQNAYVRMCAHAGSDLDNEVGGWMAGKYCIDRQSGARFIVIDTILIADQTDQGPTHLTFTGDSQINMYETLQNLYPGKVLLGWYHTHPRMGVFLSQWDVWLHQNFFPEQWQVAMVVEPHSSTGGVFIRHSDGSLDNSLYYGFHEILGNSDRSVVFWKNLRLFEKT
jgi:proteasome lid subunit RPN8/RPN11